MVDDVGDLATVALQPVAQAEQGVLVRQVHREVVELCRLLVGHAGGLRERVKVLAGVLEERDRVARRHLEEVVPERRSGECRHQARIEDAVPEADRRVHVRRHESEVVHAPPVDRVRGSCHSRKVRRRRRPGYPWTTDIASTARRVGGEPSALSGKVAA